MPPKFHKKLLPISDFWGAGGSNAFPANAL